MAKEGKTLNEQAYNELLHRIVTIVYEPGQILNEAGLVDDLKISRTPIHAACIQLQQEHLIEFLPKKGLRVTEIDANLIRELHDIRELIEPYAVRTFGFRMDKDELLQYLNILEDPHTPDDIIFETDAKLHARLIDQTNNKLLINYYATLQNHMARISNICGRRVPNRILESGDEHKKIIMALINDNYEEAEIALRQHLQQARKVAYQVLYIQSKGDQNENNSL